MAFPEGTPLEGLIVEPGGKVAPTAAVGTVTSASVVSANGFGGSVATSTTTPAITITTSVTGILMGDGTGVSAAVAGTDYTTPGSMFVYVTGYAQPLDADLLAIAALTGTNTIYYRSAANTWSPVTIGANLTFSGGTLAGTSGGSVTTVSVVSANGFAGSLATDTTTPAITLTTTVTGLLKGNGTAVSAAVANTDYTNPAGLAAYAQPLDAELTAIAGLSSAADAAPYFTGVGAAALMTVTAAARTVLDDATVGAMLATLGGQPLDADLTVLAGITIAANTFPARSSSGAAAAKAITDFGLSLVDDADATAARTTLGLGTVAVLASDTDALLGANSDLRVATQRAVKSYVDASVVGLLDLKGSVSCSGNPDYAAASKGDAYYVSSAGKIGGASGKSVDVGDVVVASADNAGGTEAAVGTSWFVLEHNLTGALVAANNLSDLASATTARGNLGLGTLATQSGTFSGTSSGTNTGDQTITLTGNVTGSGTGSFATTIAAGAVTLARMADVATATVFYRKTAGTGAPEVQTLATLKTDLGLTGTNSGDQTITLTGDVTGSGTGSFAATIASDAVTFAKMQNSAAAGLSVVGRSTNSAGDFAEINAASDGQVLRRSGTAVGFGAVDLASANAVTGVLPAANLTAASDTVAGAIEIATAAEIETGTDTVRAVTPGRQHNHKSAAKAWVVFTVSGTTVTIRDSYGLAAVNPVVRNGVGDYTLNFATAFSSAYYFVACGVCVNTAGTATLWGLPNNLAPPTASACRVIYVTSGGAANEAARVDVACFGDQ